MGIECLVESSCVGESCQSYRNGAVVGASCDDSIRVSVSDGSICFSEGMCGSGAGCNYVYAGAFSAVLDGYLSACDVTDLRRDEILLYPLSGRVFLEFVKLPLNGLESSDSRAYISA